MFDMLAGKSIKGHVTYHLSIGDKDKFGNGRSKTLGSIKSGVYSTGTIPRNHWLVASREFTIGEL